MEGMNDTIISLLLGREAVYRSLSLNECRRGALEKGFDKNDITEQACEDLDHTVHLISKSFRRECSRTR